MTRRGRKRKWGARERNGKPQRANKAKLVEERVRLARAQPHRRTVKSNDRINELAESPLGRLHLQRVAAVRQRKPDELVAQLNDERIGLNVIASGTATSADFAASKAIPGVTASQLAAGEAFAGIVGRYRSTIETPRAMRSLSIATSAEPGDVAEEAEIQAAQKFFCPSQHAEPIDKQVKIAGAVIPVREWPCQREGETCHCRERRDRYMRAYEALADAGRRAVTAVINVAVRGEEIPESEIVYLKIGLAALARHLRLTDLDR